MMGITKDDQTCGIEINYSKNFAEVFAETAIMLFKVQGCRYSGVA